MEHSAYCENQRASPTSRRVEPPIQIWVPDDRSPAFAEDAHRQSRAVATSDRADDDQAFVDSVSTWPED